MAKQRRGHDRRNSILAAAREVFLKRGYEAATLDEIIARAGGSRATIYQEFGDKQGLFAAIVGAVCEEMTLPLQANIGSRRALLDFGLVYMHALMRPENIGLYRLVIAEGHHLPALARQVFDTGPEATADSLTRMLSAKLPPAKASRAARAFLEMVKGDHHTRALFGIDQPTTNEIDRSVRIAVDIFCDGLGL